MGAFAVRTDLALAKLLVLSVSILWFPILGSVKAHQVLVALLLISGTVGGGLIRFLGAQFKCAPGLFGSLFAWGIYTFYTAALMPANWAPLDILKFVAQFVLSSYAIFLILSKSGMSCLQRYANLSLIVFLTICVFFVGYSPVESFNIFFEAIVTANPKIIIFKFFGSAPLFVELSADGLDGLRHGISQYLLLILLINAVVAQSVKEYALMLIIFILILLLQSRATWLAMFLAAFFYLSRNVFFTRHNIKTLLLALLTGCIGAAATSALLPLLFARIFESTSSYEGRLDRLTEALQLLDVSFAPQMSERMFSSSHMFLFDSYYASGLIGFLLAAVVVLNMVKYALPPFVWSRSLVSLGFIFSFPILIRMFTVGNGLPGIAAALCFGVAMYYLSLGRRAHSV